MRNEEGRRLRILVVEDVRAEFVRMKEFLALPERVGRCSRAAGLDALSRAIGREAWDVVLTTHRPPALAAGDVLAALRACRADIPVVVVCEGVGGEEAADFLRAGAADLVLRSDLARLVPAIERALDTGATREALKHPRRRLEGESAARTHEDVASRKQAELRIHSLTRLYATISAANQAIVRGRNLEEVFEAVCRACVEQGDFELAWVGLAAPDAKRILPVAAYGESKGYLDGIVIYTRADWPQGRGPTGVAYRERRVVVCNDFAADPSTGPWRSRAARFGFASSISLPLHRGGQAVGVLTAYGRARNLFDDDAVRLLQDLAENLSFALDQFDREARRVQAEEALKRSEGRLQEAQAIARIGHWDFDIASEMLTWSPQVFQLFQRDPHRGPPSLDEALKYLGDAAGQHIAVALGEAVARGEQAELEFPVTRPDGTTAYMSLIATMVRDEEGAVTHLHGTVQDITARKQAEQAIQAMANEIEDLYQNAPCGYHSLDREGRFVRVNDTELRWLGYSREEMIGRRATDFITPDSRRSFESTFPMLKAGGVVQDVEQEWIRKDGTILLGFLSATAVRNSAGRFVQSRATLVDITDRKRLEEERSRQEARSAELSRHLLVVQEEERRRLALELHDVVSPNLAALKINLGIMEQRLPRALLGDLGDRFRETRNLIQATNTSLRNICGNLRPAALDYAGLDSAVESYAQQFFHQTGVPVSMIGTESEERLPAEIESVLFRIVQEALTNCAKHSRATRVNLELTHDGEHAFLMIEDDGVGFDLEELGQAGKTPGLGLLTMGERAEFAGGRFSVESRPGEGTCITVEI